MYVSPLSPFFFTSLQVTKGHTYQSMKSRYQKVILPHINTYNIPTTWICKLSKKYKPCIGYADVFSDSDGNLNSEDDDDDKKDVKEDGEPGEWNFNNFFNLREY